MPFLPNEHSTDKLLKNLAIDLAAQLNGQELKQVNWFQYRDFDHAQTLVSTVLAADALLYLGFDQQGQWSRNSKVITAIIAFMARYYRDRPQMQDLVRLRQLIDAKPLNRQAVVDWFHTMYPPDLAPH